MYTVVKKLMRIITNRQRSSLLTFNRVLNGALLSSCSRFPMIGRAGGPGGKQNFLWLFRLNSHSRAMISPAKISVPESSIMLRKEKYAALSSATD